MKLSTTLAGLVLLLSTSVSALPTIERRWSSSSFWASQRGYTVGRRGYDYDSCDLSEATMPEAPKPLPSPSSGLSLSHVSIGRGTQNYTCDLSNSTAVPVAIGAVASLYNVSCIAALHPSLLSYIPGIALNLPVPSSSDTTSAANMDLSGHHYFLDASTPFFNLDTSLHSYGEGAFKKINATNAPSDASKGQNGNGYGAVPWLKLSEKDSSSGQVLKEVYRVNTAGGQPPTTCTGQSENVEVQYAAEYWVYV